MKDHENSIDGYLQKNENLQTIMPANQCCVIYLKYDHIMILTVLESSFALNFSYLRKEIFYDNLMYGLSWCIMRSNKFHDSCSIDLH